MDKNMKFLAGGFLTIILGVVLYAGFKGDDSNNGKILSVNSNAQGTQTSPSQTGVGDGEIINNNNTTSPKPKDTILYECKGGDSFSIKYVFGEIPPLTVLTLSDSQGKRTINLEMDTKRSSSSPTFQSKDGSVVFINNGTTATVEEKGKATFANCAIK